MHDAAESQARQMRVQKMKEASKARDEMFAVLDVPKSLIPPHVTIISEDCVFESVSRAIFETENAYRCNMTLATRISGLPPSSKAFAELSAVMNRHGSGYGEIDTIAGKLEGRNMCEPMTISGRNTLVVLKNEQTQVECRKALLNHPEAHVVEQELPPAGDSPEYWLISADLYFYQSIGCQKYEFEMLGCDRAPTTKPIHPWRD